MNRKIDTFLAEHSFGIESTVHIIHSHGRLFCIFNITCIVFVFFFVSNILKLNIEFKFKLNNYFSSTYKLL